MTLVSPSECIKHIVMSQYISVDTEGSDLDKTDMRDGTGYAVGLSVACRPRVDGRPLYSAYYPIDHETDNIDKELYGQVKYVIEHHPRVVYHNAKHDILSLNTLGIKRDFGFYDTMGMTHWLYEELRWSKYGLDFLAKRFLKDEGKKRSPEFELWLLAVGWGRKFPAKVMEEYAAYDTELTLRLFEYLYPKFKREGFDG